MTRAISMVNFDTEVRKIRVQLNYFCRAGSYDGETDTVVNAEKGAKRVPGIMTFAVSFANLG